MGLDQNEFEGSAAVLRSCNRFLSRLAGEAVTPRAGRNVFGFWIKPVCLRPSGRVLFRVLARFARLPGFLR
ncbi:MAG: hypothetical protein B5M55_04420 [Desulfococcus sp. 4484_242]|nr:MAG: hypothetical protein B5M55_04420 [Desulfococcus sp. 4484_242]